jgi:hypothetical protein
VGNDDIRHDDDFTFRGAPTVFLPSFFAAKKRRRRALNTHLRKGNIKTAQKSVAVLTATNRLPLKTYTLFPSFLYLKNH